MLNNQHSTLVVRRLTPETTFPFIIVSKSKKEISLESSQLNISISFLSTDLLHSFENRFWLYDKNPYLEKLEYSFSFQKLDLRNNVLCFSRKKKLNIFNLNSVHLFNCHKFLLFSKDSNVILSSRLLSFVKGGYCLLSFGKRMYFFHSTFLKMKNSVFSYKFWFLKNISLYGSLKYFLLNNVQLRKKDYQNPRDSLFYYKKNLKMEIVVDIQTLNQTFYNKLIKK